MTQEPRQFSPQLRTEHISRCQLREFFAWNWWLGERTTIDLGEDEIIDIYDDGVFSGIKFLAQVKGTQKSIESLLVHDRFISWSDITYSQLDRWDRSTVPIIIIIWNVDLKRGYWIDAKSQIKRLESKNGSWRSQDGNKTFTIHAPLENLLNTLGLRKLRIFLANYYLASYAQDRHQEMTISFTYNMNNPSDVSASQELEDFFAHGTPVVVDSKYISEFKHSDWYERLMGIKSPSISLQYGDLKLRSEPKGPNLTCRFDLLSREGEEISFQTQMIIAQAGAKTYQLSNEKDKSRLKIRINLPRKGQGDANIAIWIIDWGIDVIETEFILKWFDILEEGAKLFITGEYDDGTPLELEAEIPPNKFKVDMPDIFYDFVRNLKIIQRKLHQRLTLENIVFSEKDVRFANEIATLLNGDSIGIYDELLKAKAKHLNLRTLIDAMNNGDALQLHFAQESNYQLLGHDIDLGKTFWEVNLISDIAPELLEQIYLNEELEKEILLHVISGRIQLDEV